MKKPLIPDDHSFLIITLKKFSFGTNLIDWIKIFLNDQESCVINGGVKTWRTWKRCATEDPVSACLFILSGEILFTIVKNNKDIKSLKSLGNIFLYTAYADDTFFFLKNLGSMKELLDKISLFSSFSGLKPNLSKYGAARIGLHKVVKVAVCGIKCIDWFNY